MSVFGETLATEVGRRYGAPVQMMQLNHGIFDEASISVIAFDTVRLQFPYFILSAQTTYTRDAR